MGLLFLLAAFRAVSFMPNAFKLKQRLVYIAGLGHSGTTLLDLLLGVHPQVVGLGELYHVAHPSSRDAQFASYCSCGHHASTCPFWAALSPALQNIRTVEAGYERILEHLRQWAGPDIVAVDSSAGMWRILPYLKQHYELHLLLITRDFRSWMYSRTQRMRQPMAYFALRWWLENLKLRHNLQRAGLRYMGIGYEELIFQPEYLLERICAYLQIDFHPDMVLPYRSGSHIISGNISRVDPEKKKRLIYDSRWLASAGISLLAPFTAPLHRPNNRWVYGNIRDAHTQQHFLYNQARRQKLANQYN
jgi:hypothetical protein